MSSAPSVETSRSGFSAWLKDHIFRNPQFSNITSSHESFFNEQEQKRRLVTPIATVLVEDDLAFNARLHGCMVPPITSTSSQESFELQTNSTLNASFEDPRSILSAQNQLSTISTENLPSLFRSQTVEVNHITPSGRTPFTINVNPRNKYVPHKEVTASTRANFSLDTFKEIIEKIGEGTFSSVYKARPIHRSKNMKEEFVAIKRIYPSCSPARILNEMKMLRRLTGCPTVLSMYEALRHEDQVSLVLPFVPHDKFKDMIDMSMDQMKSYMRALLESLSHLHQRNIIHRDVKPGNFLCNFKTNQFMLVDFGLAETRNPDSDVPKRNSEDSEPPHKRMRLSEDSDSSQRKCPSQGAQPPRPTTNCRSKAMQATRAGTRGFRAPEILLKFREQTTAIDVWSVGVILLSLMSKRYPFFISPDDLSSLAEIAAVFGTEEVSRVGERLGRRVTFPRRIERTDLKGMCERLSGRKGGEVEDSAYDLLSKCLEIDHEKRITCIEALRHPFFCQKEIV
ncbi:hypothetical protein PROFUN_11968 [Planoprotostelium fungivorum]|uniref:non-specific serine/threonine protein kinase n=1 Tax=Planoprotostelium fungivorum TaxID=1890364 RepID=A0A2P6N903_9EUKA|nr:hypothetical protein PROFUN_11968 [Planoprotostelium fungivorum]